MYNVNGTPDRVQKSVVKKAGNKREKEDIYIRKETREGKKRKTLKMKACLCASSSQKKKKSCKMGVHLVHMTKNVLQMNLNLAVLSHLIKGSV